MKKNVLTLLFVALATVAFAQTPKHLRVLNYVPDSCYSLSLMNFDTLARALELEALHRENVLEPVYDSLKISKKIIQSWVNRDNKVGVDFTATAAFADSRYLLLPLNNEKKFEKTVRSLKKSMPPFVTMTAPDGKKVRCMALDDKNMDMGMAVICTEDVACVALLVDLNAFYSAIMEYDFDRAQSMAMETPMQVWGRLIRSQFANSETAKVMMKHGWDSYSAYNQQNAFRYIAAVLLEELSVPSEEIQRTIGQLDMEVFARGDVSRDRITAFSEFRQRTPIPEFQALKTSPKELKRLMPYVSGDYFVFAVSSVEGFADLAKPYMATLPQWREIAPLLNKPFVITLSATDDLMQLSTLVDHPGEVRGMLDRFVTVSNHITDSLRKFETVSVVEVEEPVEESIEEVVVEEPVTETPEPEGLDNALEVERLDALYDDNVAMDSTINMKTLDYRKINGWDTYIITTKKRNLDYETFTWLVQDDSVCVFVKDDLLFCTKSLASLGNLSQPLEREWPEEYFSHPFYARVDFGEFLTAVFGPEAMPVRDMVCFVDENTFTMNINAVPGLRHGVLYEMVKYVMEILK